MESKNMKITCNECGSLYDVDIPEGASIESIKCTCERESKSGVDLAKEYASVGVECLYHTRIAAFLKGYAAGKANALKEVREWAEAYCKEKYITAENGVAFRGTDMASKMNAKLLEFLEEQTK